MTDLESVLATIAHSIEKPFDAAKLRLQRRLGYGEIMIQPYLGHGTQERLYLKGRVLRDQGITSAMDDDTIWTNLLNMYKRYQSDEIPGARVRATFGELTAETVTDREGYFYFELAPKTLPEAEGHWYDIDLELVDYKGKDDNFAEPMEVRATGKVIVPPPDAQFGVISDIDDTVMRTDVVDLLAMARNTFFNNAHTRLPFEGVAAFYDALRRGGDGQRFNPIYYVSSSPWNLYDMISEFFAVRGIPMGPLFLVDIGLTSENLYSPGHHAHKTKSIQTLLDTHPDLPFILIGDSSQKDPEIYYEMVTANPGRILAVYIRDVTLEKRAGKIQEIIEALPTDTVDMLLVKDTVGAAIHAAEHGFIHKDALPKIREERKEDQQAPTPLEAAIQTELANAQRTLGAERNPTEQ